MAKEKIHQLAKQLAQDLNDFYYDYDTYGYKDAVDNPEEEIRSLEKFILRHEFDDIIADLQSIADEDEPVEDINQAKDLIRRLENYKEVTEAEEE